MKRIILLFLSLTALFHASAQEYEVKLSPNEVFKSNLSLKPFIGFGSMVNLSLPVTFNWNDATNLIDIKLLGNPNDVERIIYFFQSRISIRDVSSRERDVWFSKPIRRTTPDGFLQSCYGSLVNVTMKNWPESKKLMSSPEIASFQFELQDPEIHRVQIEIRAYISSRQKKFLSRRRVNKIEYMAKMVFNITLQDLCEQPELLQTLNVIKTRTLQINTILTELDSLISNKSCSQAKMDDLRKPTAGYEVIQVTEKYNKCASLHTEIELYNTALQNIQSRKCPEPPPPLCPPQACRAMFRAMETANPKLYELALRIQKDKNRDYFEIFRNEYRAIKRNVDAVSCPTCNISGNTTYSAYLRWCSGIDELLK